MKKIFVVEDDKTVCAELVELLNNAGYCAFALQDFTQAEEEILRAQADLILLDINIPNVNGEILLKEIRKQTDTPVIMVTSRTSEADEVLSFSYGADDYITKPYSPTVLLLHISAVLKRAQRRNDVLYYRNFAITPINLRKSKEKWIRKDRKNSCLFSCELPDKGTLSDAEREIYLTKNEMIIFQHLLENKNRIVSRDELMTELWNNDEFINDNALTVNISRLRTKLATLGCRNVIETRKKQGYLLLE